jgi:hypothetical protein
MICTLFIPWFGPLPFYADIFLNCCALSENILWVVHSDQLPPDLPKNVRWYVCDDVSKRLEKVFDKEIIPERKWHHKLCDLKPFWHIIFNENDVEKTEYRGWCDWDVVHNLSALEFNFESAKFTNGSMCSPLYLQINQNILEWYTVYPRGSLAIRDASGWDELGYLHHINSTIIQPGLTPEVDLFNAAPYAVHMYRAKHSPDLYQDWIQNYCGFSLAT